MTSRDRGQALLLSFRLVAWAWFCLFLHGLDPAATAVATDLPPRAVLVSLALEHDLRTILSSISQLEDTFNSRYRYDWVFFSTRPLSEEFRRLTSNATNATCMYEVICDEHWTVPHRAPYSASLPAQPAEGVPAEGARGAEADVEYGSYEATSHLPQIRRWKSGPFAKENRLKGYDWFWRIEPGAQFVHDIDFDVFRVMRDYGIAYGSNKAGVDEAHMQALSQHVKGFMDSNPDLVHAEADISWLLSSANEGDDVPADNSSLEGGDETAAEDCRSADGGILGTRGCSAADGLPDESGDADEVASPAEAFASWLGSIYKSSLSPTFEIGSLAFLRSRSHQALFEHLDKAGDFYYRGMRDTSTPTLSASMFLHQKSVLHCRKREKRQVSRPSPPDSTPKPKLNLVRIARDVGAGAVGSGSGSGAAWKRPKEAMGEWLAMWELLARDVGRQGVMPGLRSGNTVMDERNFALDASK